MERESFEGLGFIEQPLQIATTAGDIVAMGRLFDDGTEISALHSESYAALHLAASLGT